MAKTQSVKFMAVIADYMVHVAKFVYQSENSCWVLMADSFGLPVSRVRVRDEGTQIRIIMSVDGSTVLRQILFDTSIFDEARLIHLLGYHITCLRGYMEILADFEDSFTYTLNPEDAPTEVTGGFCSDF